MIKTRTAFAFIYHWHQRIGLAMAIAIICWGLSGFAHPLISRLNPQPAAFAPPQAVLQLDGIAALEELLNEQQIAVVQQVRLFQWADQAVYRLHSEQGVAYFDATSLQPITDGDARYGEYLARHFLGDSESPVTGVSSLHSFDRDYLYINRYLPVLRVDFDRPDRMRAYIDTEQGRLATLVDTRKAVTGQLFRWFHSWTWLDNLPLRRVLMSSFLLLGLVTALFGLAVYIQSWRLGIYSGSARRHHPTSRRVHRSLGALVAVAVMAFCVSGLLHLWMTSKSDAPQPRLTARSSAAGLRLHPPALRDWLQDTPISAIELTHIEGLGYWRIVPQEHKGNGRHHHHAGGEPRSTEVIYLDARTGTPLAHGGQEHARQLATVLSGYPASAITDTELVTSFSRSEYGFINKRLPVHAVHFDLPGSPAVYVETGTGTLASLATTSRRLEGYSFGWLHKWRFADSLGKNLRDGLQSLTAGAIILVLLLGLIRFFRR